MKIIDRETFLALPPGTLFQEYEPQAFGPLQVFEGPFGSNDYVSEPITDLAFEPVESSEQQSGYLYLAEKTGESMPIIYGKMASRDGCFNNGTLYAVYEKQDVARLIHFLQKQYKRLPE